jgi:hypothetical protein
MRLVDIIAEYYYLKDATDSPLIPFAKQESNVRDFYFRIAYHQIPQLLHGYLTQHAWLGNLVSGCITNFINSHGVELNKTNYNSLAKRITTNISGAIKTK